MSATQIQNALPGEDLLAIAPSLQQQPDLTSDPIWLQRLSLFTGRTLSDTALSNEQLYRAGRLTMLGQAVTPGTVQGLDLSVNLSIPDPGLIVAPGYGISATGQDVTLQRTLKTSLSGIAVLNGETGDYLSDFGSYAAPTGPPWAAIFLLQPVVVSLPGSAVDTGPANTIVSGNLGASCSQDPDEYAFSDPQLVDAARLVLLTWPSDSASLALPDALPTGTWRNRLAYTVFNAELALATDARLPWEFLGVPLAIAGFDATAKLIFADRSAVVRQGGQPRRRYVLPGSDTQGLAVVQPALAVARVNQLAEQLGAIVNATSTPGLIASQFKFLPPSGILPREAVDLPNKIALWPPANWTVTAVPVYAEELEGVLQSSITAAPLDTTEAETIEILVPLPDSVYDPNVLMTEIADPVFAQEVAAATQARDTGLRHLQVIQLRANVLASVLNQPQTVVDLTAGPSTSLYADEAYGTVQVEATDPITSVDINGLMSAAGSLQSNFNVGGTVSVDTDLTSFAASGLPAGVGLQGFMDTLQAKIDKANDLLDLSFLTSQTDIYRYRQNVLAATDATRLAVSPVLANIASGNTATTTAQNIQGYLASLPTTTGSIDPQAAGTRQGAATAASANSAPQSTSTPQSAPSSRQHARLFSNIVSSVNARVNPTAINITTIAGGVSRQSGVFAGTFAGLASAVNPTFAPISVGTIGDPASTTDVTQQSPIVGEQLDLRTVTIAERLAQPPSQEALLYSVGNRVAALNQVANLDLAVGDLPIAVDVQSSDAPTAPAGSPFTVADLTSASTDRVAELQSALALPLDYPTGGPNADEATMFSTGIHVLEQHTQLLRLIEGRVQQYNNFLTQCATALASVQTFLGSAQTKIAQLQNDLNQAQQNLAFVEALFNDEQARASNVNATRASVLANYVPYIAYVRPRTLIDTPRTPSRQLVPANVVSPVPACLQQSVAVPPELREMVALLREAPVSWFPLIQSYVTKLERPALLQGLAQDMQVRASTQLQSPLQASSAATVPGIYSTAIANVYVTSQQTVRSCQTQRQAFDSTQLTNQSWSSQVSILQNTAGVADLMSSQYVHTEISNLTSRSLQQMSSVATCLYTRVGNALPAVRLQWAEFLSNTTTSINLRSLAALPGWNSQDYIDRQQMQLLVDWLFLQLNRNDQTANALLSDLIAVAILLASNAPTDAILAGAVALRTKPLAGATIRLTLPSDRVAHGMNVNLYSKGTLAAHAVVSDLDSTGATATITDVYKPGVPLEANDIAHYTALDRNAVVYKAFSTN